MRGLLYVALTFILGHVALNLFFFGRWPWESQYAAAVSRDRDAGSLVEPATLRLRHLQPKTLRVKAAPALQRSARLAFAAETIPILDDPVEVQGSLPHQASNGFALVRSRRLSEFQTPLCVAKYYGAASVAVVRAKAELFWRVVARDQAPSVPSDDGRDAPDVLQSNLRDQPSVRYERGNRVGDYQPRSHVEIEAALGYPVAFLCGCVAALGFYKDRLRKPELPISQVRVNANNDHTASGCGERPIINPVSRALQRVYRYIAGHVLGLAALALGVLIDFVGLGITFFCDQCSGPVRAASGLLGVVVPGLILIPWALSLLGFLNDPPS